MKKSFLASLLLLSLLLCSCSYNKNVETPDKNNVQPTPSASAQTNTEPSSQPASVPANAEKPKYTRKNYPKIDGSTATIPLSESVASNLLGITKEEAKKFIKHNTTHSAYVNLINKTADLILVTEPSLEELQIAKDAKIELEIVPVVKEGFVFLVNTNNPVNSLTSSQIRDIYQGRIRNWKAVGGEDKEIVAYQRDSNSGSQTLMEQIVMKGLHMMDSPKTIVTGMEGLIESIAKYDNSDKALGYSVFYYAKAMYNRDTIKFIAIDGIMPDNKTISSGKYPFTSAYYAVMRKSEPQDSSVRQLLNWLLGSEGQKIAEESGYVPLQVR